MCRDVRKTGLEFAQKVVRKSAFTRAKEVAMICHRRTWFYRLAGQDFAQKLSFRLPLTEQRVRELLHRRYGPQPIEVWAH